MFTLIIIKTTLYWFFFLFKKSIVKKCEHASTSIRTIAQSVLYLINSVKLQPITCRVHVQVTKYTITSPIVIAIFENGNQLKKKLKWFKKYFCTSSHKFCIVSTSYVYTKQSNSSIFIFWLYWFHFDKDVKKNSILTNTSVSIYKRLMHLNINKKCYDIF